MAKPHPYQPQRHPSGRGYEVIDHRDMSLHGHWVSEEIAATMATTWNMRELEQERDELLDALRWALDQIEDSLDPDHQAALAAAHAAIAKATGEAA